MSSNGIGKLQATNGKNGTGKLAAKIGLCVCAGQLIAGPVLATAAQAAPVAVTAKPASPTVVPGVSEAVSSTRISSGSMLRVGVRVTDPRTGRGVTQGKVRLQYAVGNSWRTWQTKSVTKTGMATFNVRPGSGLRLRSVYSGTSVIQARISNVVQVTMVSSSGKGAKILAEAKRHTGALYQYGASGPARFDCSGFTQYVFRKAAGTSLPHKADAQQNYGKAVGKGSAQPGDLIVFRSGSYGYHAAVYAGGSYVYDSPHTGARVGKHKIFSSNYVVRRMA
jgi:cell wall-associated NlpC family hydrolase